MRFFERFVSNSLAGTGNQRFVTSDGNEQRARTFYKIYAGGEYAYSFLFSNIIDSTYDKGQDSRCNLICDSWTVTAMRVAVCDTVDNAIPQDAFQTVTFSGKTTKEVAPAEFFSTDPITLDVQKDQYLCIETVYCGRMIPCQPKGDTAGFILKDGQWVPCLEIPFASMIGCDRAVKRRIAYLGDSITQGTGVAFNSYRNWCALLSEKLGEDNAYWNLGLGFGRGSDAASDGAWLFKAKQNDVVFVCFGVNDIWHGQNGYIEEQLRETLDTIVRKLKERGCTVILQTIPPFGYPSEKAQIWKRTNDYIRTVLSEKVDMVMDIAPLLSAGETAPEQPKYGGHPDEVGCAMWAEELYQKVKPMFK